MTIPIPDSHASPPSWLDLVMAAPGAMGASRDEQAHVLAGTSLATYRLKGPARRPLGGSVPALVARASAAAGVPDLAAVPDEPGIRHLGVRFRAR